MQCACAIFSSVSCPALQYFSMLSHKRHDFRKKSCWAENICFEYFYNFFFRNIFHSKKIWARYDQKRILFFTYSNLYCCPILMKREFSRQIFEKYSNIKFHEHPSSESQVVPSGQTDRRTDMAKLIVAFRNFANAPKIVTLHISFSAKTAAASSPH
jgi:hypothetical protein